MQRVLTTLLVLLALTGVVSGNLLRPCDCHGEDGIDAHARCQSQVLVSQATSGCCGACHARAPVEEPAEGENSGDDEGCALCCKPRAPLGETDDSVAVNGPELWVAASAGEAASTLELHHPLDARGLELEHERRTIDPRLLSPEGLGVFLI